jgi:eukaryotic-like serine/threonine-protein kinase
MRGLLRSGDLVSDTFRIERELDRGAMGVVYLADDLRHGRKVAVKVLSPLQDSRSAAARFFREIRSAAGLSHPNILPVHDSGDVEGVPYYVTPFVDGETLRARLNREECLRLYDALHITRQLAAALACAHAHRDSAGAPAPIVHRDVKPENVLLDSKSNAYLADFGIALPCGATRDTQDGFPIGSPHYMSPEQIEGARDLDGRSDLYGLGCLLFEMLTGSPPFDGAVAWVISQHLSVEPPPLRSRRTDLPFELEEVMRKALAKSRSRRFASADELLRALDAAPIRNWNEDVSRAPSTAVSSSPPSPRMQRRSSDRERVRPGTGSASLVVLPFEDMSPGASEGHFCDGLVEEIITTLSRVPGVRTVPRTSAFAFRNSGRSVREVAGALGVSHVVEGSARFASNRYRVTVRLLDADREIDLWHDPLTFEGALTPDNIFELQDQIAGAVGEKLAREIGSGVGFPRMHAPPRRPLIEAYELYLRGRKDWFRRTPEGFASALDLFEEAASLDPSYAQAHCGIADVYCLLGAFDYAALPPRVAYGKAEEAARRALELDPTLGPGHAALGNALISHEWKLDEAESCYRTAIALDPGNSSARQWRSSLLFYRGQTEAAFGEGERALERDPRSAYLTSNLARLYQLSGQPGLAIPRYRHALEMDPGLFTAQVGLALADMSLGHGDAAVARLTEVDAKTKSSIPLVTAIRGYLLGRVGREDEARAVLHELEQRRVAYESAPASTRYLPPEDIAIVHLGLGEHERTLVWLERARDAGSQAMITLGVEPIAEPLRTNRRFQELIRSVGLPDPSREILPGTPH